MFTKSIYELLIKALFNRFALMSSHFQFENNGINAMTSPKIAISVIYDKCMFPNKYELIKALCNNILELI